MEKKNWETVYTRQLDEYHYIKVKIVEGKPKVICYHHNRGYKNVSMLFCVPFDDIETAYIFANNFVPHFDKGE